MREFLVGVFLVLVLTSCATLFSGSRDNITLNSEPPGAVIFIDGLEQGRTPATISVKRPGLGDRQITLKLSGYEDRTFTLQKEFNTVAILNIFMFPGFIIDIVTGAIMRYDPTSYTMELNPRGNTYNMRDLPQTADGSYVVPSGGEQVVLMDYPTGLMVVFE